MKTPGNTPSNDQFPPEFEQSQDAQDLMLLTELANDFGGPQKASGVVCLAEMIGGAEVAASKFVNNMIQAKKDGKLRRPELLALRDDEYEDQMWQSGRQIAASMARKAAHDLDKELDGVSRQEQGIHVEQLLSILGVSRVGDDFLAIPRDEGRARKVVEVAKLMDPGYRQWVGLNPEFVAEVDPASAAVLEGVPIEDPALRQKYRELRDEL